MTPPWRIELFGGLRALQGSRSISRYRTQKTGALLGYLAYFPTRPHTRERLIDLLWPEYDEPSGRNCLSIALSSLRHLLEPPGVAAGSVLCADRRFVQLTAAAVTTDVAAFEAALQAAARAREDRERLPFLEQAVTLYHGRLLQGYDSAYEDDWVLPEQQRLADLYFDALLKLTAHLTQMQALERALDYARRAITLDPWREEAHCEVMRLYARMGQPEAGLRQYQALERFLEQELGETPSPATRRLARQLQERVAQSPPVDLAPAPIVVPVPAPAPAGTVTFLAVAVAAADARPQPEHAELRTEVLPAQAAVAAPAARPMPEAGSARTGASPYAALLAACGSHGGHAVDPGADYACFQFARAREALAFALACPQLLGAPATEASLRMALHTGEVAPDQEILSAPALAHTARLLAATPAGQILCSEETSTLLRRHLDPGRQLSDLGAYYLRDAMAPERLFRLDPAGAPGVPLPGPSAEPAWARALPLARNRCFGREELVASLENRLLSTQSALLTLTGPGGIGKTRMTLELAARMVESAQRAVWFVPLGDLAHPDLLPGAIAQALGLAPAALLHPLEEVAAALARRPALLILDNFEQLLPEGTPVVRALLERVPSLLCLVTSRQALDLPAERVVHVPPLATPPATETRPQAPEQLSRYPSIQLFVDRAQSVRPDFQITPGNALALEQLCRRLEGIPLAIELAATRAQVLTPAQMLVQLTHRFDFLVSRRREISERHRTLRAAVDWSYRLLSPPLQRFFAQLWVFRGGWTVEAVEEVCREEALEGAEPDPVPALDYLAQLQECSLLLAEEQGSEIRFRLLETLREYAGAQLTSEQQAGLQQRHARYYRHWAKAAGSQVHGPDQESWLNRLEWEHDNLRAALAWLLEQNEDEDALSLAAALVGFWYMRGHVAEGRSWLERALRREFAAVSAGTRGDALNGAGVLASLQGDYAAAHAFHEASLALRREQGKSAEIAGSLNNLGTLAQHQGKFDQARGYYEESLTLYRQLEHRWGIAVTVMNLSGIATEQADYDRARALLEESLALHQELGDRLCMAADLHNLGEIAFKQADYANACTLLQRAISHWAELGDRGYFVSSLHSLGLVARAQGNPVRAARLLGAEEALREQIQVPLPSSDVAEHARAVTDLQAVLGVEAFAAAWAEGRATGLERSIAYALETT